MVLGEPSFFPTLEAYSTAPIVGGNSADVLLNGEEIFPAMLEAIHEARKTITYAQYFYEDGPVARDMAEALAERCRAGVGVNVLLDSFGALGIPPEYVDLMRRDLFRFTPVALLVILVVLWLSFWTVRGVVLPVVSVVMALVWTLGDLVLDGKELTLTLLLADGSASTHRTADALTATLAAVGITLHPQPVPVDTFVKDQGVPGRATVQSTGASLHTLRQLAHLDATLAPPAGLPLEARASAYVLHQRQDFEVPLDWYRLQKFDGQRSRDRHVAAQQNEVAQGLDDLRRCIIGGHALPLYYPLYYPLFPFEF